MGTNFYIKGYSINDNTNPEWHIGKRSAAGKFCFDCDITLCKDGASGVHKGDRDWYDACPKCGKPYTKEDLENSSAGLELGFNKNPEEVKTGVKTASSFTFAMERINISERIFETFGLWGDNQKVIVDEYGGEFTYYEFLKILRTIPISLRFSHLIGEHFS